MLNSEINKILIRTRNHAVVLTILITFPLGILAGMGVRAHTQQDRIESARIEADGAYKNWYQSKVDEILQSARDKINRGKQNDILRHKKSNGTP